MRRAIPMNTWTLFAAVFAAAVLWTLTAHAGIRYFELNKPQSMSFVHVCLDKEPVIDWQTRDADGDPAASSMFDAGVKTGRCANLRNVEVTYRKQLLRIDTPDKVFAVYEAELAGVTIYVPLDNILHRASDV